MLILSLKKIKSIIIIILVQIFKQYTKVLSNSIINHIQASKHASKGIHVRKPCPVGACFLRRPLFVTTLLEVGAYIARYILRTFGFWSQTALEPKIL